VSTPLECQDGQSYADDMRWTTVLALPCPPDEQEWLTCVGRRVRGGGETRRRDGEEAA